MGKSGTLAVRGLSTLPRSGWRADLSAALTIVAREPRLWVLGMAGFCLRGGVVLLTLPIVVLPTQVEVRFLLGNNLGSSGLTPGFYVLAVAAGAVAVAVALAALLGLARLELAAFEILARAPESAEQRNWRAPTELAPAARRGLVQRVYLVQLATLAAIVAATVPVAAAIGQATLDEILHPTSTDSIYQRILTDVRDPLLLFAVVLVVIELFSAAAEREALIGGLGLRGGSARRSGLAGVGRAAARALARPLRSPLRTLAAAALGWATWVVLVPIVGVALSFSWQQVRATYLADAAPGDVGHTIALLLVALLLSAVFALALFAFGFASAVRASLWSIAGLR